MCHARYPPTHLDYRLDVCSRLLMVHKSKHAKVPIKKYKLSMIFINQDKHVCYSFLNIILNVIELFGQPTVTTKSSVLCLVVMTRDRHADLHSCRMPGPLAVWLVITLTGHFLDDMLHFNGRILEKATLFKYLGIILDEKLNWKHITNLPNTITFSLRKIFL